MARIRSIHPDALKSTKLSAATPEAERAYWRLQPLCDDEGRCEDDPMLLASTMFPKREDIIGCHVDGWLTELHAGGLIVRYVIDGRRYLEVTQWKKYQKPQHKKPSEIPPPSGDSIVLMSPHEPSGEQWPGVGVGEGVGEGAGARRRPAPERAAVLTKTAELVATRRGRDIEAETKNNPSSWYRSAVSGIKQELEEWGCHAWLTEHPDEFEQELADAFEPPTLKLLRTPVLYCGHCGWDADVDEQPHTYRHSEWLTEVS